MKTIKFLFAFMLLTIANNINAQTGYQSFLNADTTLWYMNHETYCDEPYHSYEFAATGSFFIDSVFCRKLSCSYVVRHNDGHYSYIPYTTNTRNYLSEDTVSGKLWMYTCNVNDTTHFTKKLLVDMSLDVGDTFCLPLDFGDPYIDTLVYTVDSVLYLDGRKHIFMSDKRVDEYYLSINIFIEGIGSSSHLFFPIGYYWYYPSYMPDISFLFCCFKDGLHVYMDTLIWFLDGVDDCVLTYSSLYRPKLEQKITAYPNPTKDRITLEFGGARFSTLRMVNTAGATVLETTLTGQEPQYSLPLKGLPAGIYSCILSGKDGTATQKIVVE